MKRLYTYILFILLGLSTFAQTRELTGKVVSAQTKEPLIAAMVAAMTKDNNGEYQATTDGADT